MPKHKRYGPLPGVHVAPEKVKAGKDLAEFKKNNPDVFSHLGDQENAAYEELYKDFSPAPKATSPATSGEVVKV